MLTNRNNAKESAGGFVTALVASLVAWLCLWPLTGWAQSGAAQTGVPTRGFGGGAITFTGLAAGPGIVPTPAYRAQAYPAPTAPLATEPYFADTVVITSQGASSRGTGYQPTPSPTPIITTPAPPPAPPVAPVVSAPPRSAPVVAPAPAAPASAAPASAAPASAAPSPSIVRGSDQRYGQGIVSEGRLGLSIHDIGAFNSPDEGGLDVDLELLFGSPAFLEVMGRPRPHLGGKINTNGDTSYGYAGLTWDWLIRDWFLVEAALGAAVHTSENNDSDSNNDSDKDFGCRVLARAAVGAGVQFAERHKVLLVFDHVANAGVCGEYQSLDTIGFRYGYLF